MKIGLKKSTVLNVLEFGDLRSLDDADKAKDKGNTGAVVRGEPSYYDTELLYRRHPSVRSCSSIRPRPRSRQPRFGSHLDNAF